MTFEDYKTESLERIASDPRYKQHHAEIEAILRQRKGHLSVKRGVEVLTDVARSGKTTNYKIFFEACVGGQAKWNHTQMGKLAKFLGTLQRHCVEHDLPVLTALVVNQSTGECGAGFFKDLYALSPPDPSIDPNTVALNERRRSWNWASATSDHP